MKKIDSNDWDSLENCANEIEEVCSKYPDMGNVPDSVDIIRGYLQSHEPDYHD